MSDRDEWSSNLDTENALDFQDKLDPDCFVSGKVKLLKIIRTDSVINITRAYTEIFPNADTKKRPFLPTKDRYSSVRCVILKGKAQYSKILPETLFEFVFLG